MSDTKAAEAAREPNMEELFETWWKQQHEWAEFELSEGNPGSMAKDFGKWLLEKHFPPSPEPSPEGVRQLLLCVGKVAEAFHAQARHGSPADKQLIVDMEEAAKCLANPSPAQVTPPNCAKFRNHHHPAHEVCCLCDELDKFLSSIALATPPPAQAPAPEIDMVQPEEEYIRQKLREASPVIEHSGVCHCGEPMEGHPVWDNHSPVEMTREASPTQPETCAQNYQRTFHMHDGSSTATPSPSTVGPDRRPAFYMCPDCPDRRQCMLAWKCHRPSAIPEGFDPGVQPVAAPGGEQEEGMELLRGVLDSAVSVFDTCVVCEQEMHRHSEGCVIDLVAQFLARASTSTRSTTPAKEGK